MRRQKPLQAGAVWKAVSEFSGASTPEDNFVHGLLELLRTAGIKPMLLECGASHRAVVVPSVWLPTVTKRANTGLQMEGISDADIDPSDQMVFIFTVQEEGLSEAILSLLNGDTAGVTSPCWAGVVASSPNKQLLLQVLADLDVAASSDTIKLQQGAGSPMVFELYRIPSALDQFKQFLVRGAAKKVPEGPDNLRRRGEWFRQRVGPPQ